MAATAGGEPWHFAWQVKYTVLFWACALLLAAFFTYLIEKPTAKQLAQKEENHPYIETDRHGVFHAFGGLSSYSVRVTENYSVLPSSFWP